MKNYFFLFLMLLLVGCSNDFYEGLENSNTPSDLLAFLKSQKKSDLKIPNYRKAILGKLDSYEINDEGEIMQFAELLDAPKYYNIIVVPDLSNRIVEIKKKAGYDQAEYDKKVIIETYNILADYKKVNFKNKNKDIFSVDLTEETQSIGEPIMLEFKDISENTFSVHEKSLKAGLDKLYQSALSKDSVIGNDFRQYFENHVNSTKIKKSTFSEIWLNKIVILTDGYLEPSKGKTYTDINLPADKYPIPSINRQYSNLDIMVCEVHLRERDGEKGENLKKYWYNWFKDMGIGNLKDTEWWVLHDNNSNLLNTKNAIKVFLEYKKKGKKDIAENKVAVVEPVAKTIDVTPPQATKPKIEEPKVLTSAQMATSKKSARLSKTIKMSPKISSGSKKDTCTTSYDEIYDLTMKEDLDKRDLVKLVELQNIFLTLGCSSEYNEIVEKSKQTISELLKTKQ